MLVKHAKIFLRGFHDFILERRISAASIMCNSVLEPPECVSGMRKLNKDLFRKTVNVPTLCIPSKNFQKINSCLKKYYLKMPKFKPVVDFNSNDKRIFLNPDLVENWNFLHKEFGPVLSEFEIDENNFSHLDVNFNYDNWNADGLLKAILPKDKDSVSSYSIIGHIVHINLNEDLMEYKQVIGEILLDKVNTARTVVNKINKIDNEYRNFEMELLCGENNMVTRVKENQTVFDLDFSAVYWNSRLSTEHGRVVQLLNKNDVVFDVFCGIGPFSIPAAKKKCLVFANDLNPQSFKWLNHNIQLNKINNSFIQTFNKDGKDFIINDVKNNLLTIWADKSNTNAIHIIMNLPGLAIEFVKYFQGLFSKSDFNNTNFVDNIENKSPILHVYCFVTGDNSKDLIPQLFKQNTGLDLQNMPHNKIQFVRNVSPKKDMYKIEFKFPSSFYLSEECEPDFKKIRTEL